jgi:DNA polymerase III subunit gamma/tau
MAYIPLHHKYRPQTFADLVGQEAISTTLTNALRLEKIAPAYLFTGPRGTGKTSSARILAKSLNCMTSQVPTAQPCGKCEVCSSIAVGTALDIIEIDAASNTGVDNIRELIERAQYAPVQCRYKVYIIDECHMLTTAAFNSLLKTLEEPPLHVVFILATTDPQRVLPTIISRCQRFDYRRIPVEAMVKHLTEIATIEQIEISPAAVTLIAQLAQGGLRDAESLLDRLSLLSGEITPDRVSEAIGSVPERDLLDILQAIATADPENLLDRTRQILERGKEPLTVLQNLAAFYRDLTIAKTAPKRSDLVALTTETWAELVKIAKTWELRPILAGQQHLKESEHQLKNSTQPQLWLEIAILGLLAVGTQPAPVPQVAAVPAKSLAEPLGTRIAPPPAAPASQPAPPSIPDRVAPPPVAAVAAPAPIDNLDLVSTWERVLQQLLPASRDLFKPFGTLISVSELQAVVAMKSSTMQTIATGKVPELAKVFSHIFGREIAVKLEVMGKISMQPSSAPAPAPVAAPPPPPAPVEPAPPVAIPPSPPTALPVVGEYLTDDEIEEDAEDLEEPIPLAASLPAIDPTQPVAAIPQSGGYANEPPPEIAKPEPAKVVDLFPSEEPPDFAEPPDSFDVERAANAATFESAEPEEDPELAAATDKVVRLFSGEVIDRDSALFDRIVGN